MTKELPPSPSLSQLKKLVKELRKSHASGESSACKRIQEFHPKYKDSDEQYEAAPLACAARAGQLDMVKFLLSKGVKMRYPGDKAWSDAGILGRKKRPQGNRRDPPGTVDCLVIDDTWNDGCHGQAKRRHVIGVSACRRPTSSCLGMAPPTGLRPSYHV